MDNNSPLFLAHQNGRNADKFLKKKAFDQAIECHLNAIVFLQEAMTLTTFSKSLESLQLQKNYHLSQTDIIRTKKVQFSLKKQIAELKKKKRMEKKRLPEEEKDQELQWAVLRAVEEAERLVSQVESQEVRDDLRTVHTQLRGLLTKLLHHLDSSRREADSLRSRLRLYEGQALPDLAPLELPNFDFSQI